MAPSDELIRATKDVFAKRGFGFTSKVLTEEGTTLAFAIELGGLKGAFEVTFADCDFVFCLSSDPIKNTKKADKVLAKLTKKDGEFVYGEDGGTLAIGIKCECKEEEIVPAISHYLDELLDDSRSRCIAKAFSLIDEKENRTFLAGIDPFMDTRGSN